jgi:Holliday junction resolvase RusA-like endonuclease
VTALVSHSFAGPYSFHINGVPAPMGSKIRTRYGMFESSKRVAPWQQMVIAAVHGYLDGAALFGAIDHEVRVDTHFYFRKPRTTKAAYPVAPTIGDGDKLTRATWDGLVKGGLLADDRFIVAWGGSKQWAGQAEEPGCIVQVWAA